VRHYALELDGPFLQRPAQRPLLGSSAVLSAASGRRVTMSAVSIARRFGATRQGHNFRVLCPCDCGYGLRFCDGEDGRLLAICDGGCDFNEIVSALVPYGLLDGEDDDGLSPDSVQREDAKHIAQRIANARHIYGGGSDDDRIRVYLRSRFISLIPPILRFSEEAPHRLGVRLPAMLAPIVDINGEQTGVHMTYLRRDGAGKADLPKEYQRECRGVISGGMIRLAEFDPNAMWHHHWRGR
jgi:hypothetical protein